MPKFVSGSSGHIYFHSSSKNNNKAGNRDDEPDLASLIPDPNSEAARAKQKPSAVNKKGTKEEKRNSLDLFKEELKRIQDAKEEQKNKLKRVNSKEASSKLIEQQHDPLPSSSLASTRQQIPVLLKPDPRCPTGLTLQVNPATCSKDKESLSGSHDNGDPTTTNLYVGNINPSVNESDLCDMFGKFGPLASIKIMWPRTEEEKARNRNSGFVAYMSRFDAERALRALNGIQLRGYDMKLGEGSDCNKTETSLSGYHCTQGWGKAVPIPKNPVYVPPELMNLLIPPPSGLPFNAQLHEDDIKRGYIVPAHYPQPLMPELEGEAEHNPDLLAVKEAHEEFVGVLRRSIVKVVAPSDRAMLDRIQSTIEYVTKEGPISEALLIAREQLNPDFRFLYDHKSYEHIYYRWKLFSALNGDDPDEWPTEEFRLFENGPLWRPPPLNPFAGGMPKELIVSDEQTDSEPVKPRGEKNSSSSAATKHDTRVESTLDQAKRDRLAELLQDLEPTKVKIGIAMMFCIDHAQAAREIVDQIQESLQFLDTPVNSELARLFLISDILNNCSAAVTNASFYREGFQTKMINIFECLRQYLVNISDRQEADKFKHKILTVLGAWREWTLYENEFLINLSNILLGIRSSHDNQPTIIDHYGSNRVGVPPVADQHRLAGDDATTDLDGVELDEETLSMCLESKGLSLRWYLTLELSEDEADDVDGLDGADVRDFAAARGGDGLSPSSLSEQIIKFKSSKWETLDPSEVAGQAVTISKWEAMARAEEEDGITDSSSSASSSSPVEGQQSITDDYHEPNKRMRMADSPSRSDSSNQ